jgi:hypothetical protein
MKISIKETFFLRSFSFLKIPLLFFVSPVVVKKTDEEVVISIPFLKRNRNHLGSMYFGTLCIGADIAGGFIMARLLNGMKGGKPSFLFKDFQAKFLKRPEGDTYFTCRDGLAIQEAVKKAQQTFERVDLPVRVVATVPKISGEEPVAEFTLTLSLKVKK